MIFQSSSFSLDRRRTTRAWLKSVRLRITWSAVILGVVLSGGILLYAFWDGDPIPVGGSGRAIGPLTGAFVVAVLLLAHAALYAVAWFWGRAAAMRPEDSFRYGPRTVTFDDRLVTERFENGIQVSLPWVAVARAHAFEGITYLTYGSRDGILVVEGAFQGEADEAFQTQVRQVEARAALK